MGVFRNVNLVENFGDALIAGRVFLDPGAFDEPFLHQDCREPRQAPGVSAGADGEMDVRHGGGLAAARVDDDEGAVRILLDLP